MRIGIDFDNTIACYDGVFHRVAVERELIPQTLGTDKNTVRNYLREIGKEDDWTELQGYVYGARMDLVNVYDGFMTFVEVARAKGHDLVIVSHKTKTPFMGPKYDLHEAAREFLVAKKISATDAVPAIFFELTLEEKAARIEGEGCDFFVDDLPELLFHSAFPEKTARILFDPDNHHEEDELPSGKVARHSSWKSISDALLS